MKATWILDKIKEANPEPIGKPIRNVYASKLIQQELEKRIHNYWIEILRGHKLISEEEMKKAISGM